VTAQHLPIELDSEKCDCFSKQNQYPTPDTHPLLHSLTHRQTNTHNSHRHNKLQHFDSKEERHIPMVAMMPS